MKEAETLRAVWSLRNEFNAITIALLALGVPEIEIPHAPMLPNGSPSARVPQRIKP